MTFISAIYRRLRRHRLLVVLPIVAVMTAFTVREMTVSQAMLTGSEPKMVAAADSTKDVTLSDGTILQLYPFAGVVIDEERVVLERGSMLVMARGIARITAGTTDISLFSGSAHLTMEADGVTVAAISAPVVVQTENDVLIVPVGMQWQMGQTVMALPESFMREMIAAEDDLVSRPFEFPRALTDVSSDIPALLRFAAADERAEQEAVSAQLTHLMEAFVENDVATVQTMLLDPSFHAFLEEDSVRSSLPLLMHLAEQRGVTEAFVGTFMQLPDAWMLSALHPALRDHAWTLDLQVPDTARAVALLALPQADTSAAGVVSLTVDRWGSAWTAYLAEQDDPIAILQEALPILKDHITQLQAQGYPLRVRQYSDAVQSFALPYRDSLTSESLLILETITELADPATSLETVEVETEIQEAPAAVIKTEEISAMSAEDAVSQARALLGEQGFMFTANTVLSFRVPTFVDVTAVVLGTAKGDQLLSFTLDVAKNEVSGIIVDGVVSPYGMGLADYVQWVRGE